MLSQKTIDIIKSTIPVLEIHGKTITTVFYRNLFEKHPELLNIFNRTNQEKGRQQTALANTVLAAAVHIDRLEAILPVVKQIAQKHRSLAVKPEHYPVVGEHLLGAIKEVLGEAASPEILQAWGEAYGVIAQVFIDIEKDMYEEAASQPGGWKDYKTFKIADKVKESDVITSFYLAPADGDKLPSFEPGQYVTVRLQLPDEAYLLNRQYSLSTAPGKDYYRISVKREADEAGPEGRVSTHLHDHLEIGDTVELTAPAGTFTLDLEKQSPVVFISGGVGITPLMSMVQSLTEAQPERPASFIAAARNGQHLAFRQELNALHEKHGQLTLAFVYENPSDDDRRNIHHSQSGYINESLLRKHIPGEPADFYICGPALFLKAIIDMLRKEGVEENRIHFEFFAPSMNLEEIG